MKKWVSILGHVFNAGCYALHLWTVWIAYFMKGWPAMVLTFLTLNLKGCSPHSR